MNEVRTDLPSATCEIRVANIRLSNSLTVEKNVLGGGSIGHILRNRTFDLYTYEATDRWFHYNQVGSVIATSNASGNLVTRRFSDAFGNAIDSGTMAWLSRSAGAGWGHNTKEHDATTGFVYMYQRWYMPETGTFLSRAPYPPMVEHPYGFAEGNPVMLVDPDGGLAFVPILIFGGLGGWQGNNAVRNAGRAQEAAAGAYACRQARSNYQEWMSNPKLLAHPRSAALQEVAYREYLEECGLATYCVATAGGMIYLDHLRPHAASGSPRPASGGRLGRAPLTRRPSNPKAYDPIPPPVGMP